MSDVIRYPIPNTTLWKWPRATRLVGTSPEGDHIPTNERKLCFALPNPLPPLLGLWPHTPLPHAP